ncbi:MIP family Ig-specific serine endopeptidase [Mycoplasma nasistruthionis]|uniref:DUF31 domain-containing protein n=1 Tax=Mycoplasma nasistruthionis TaxID=353852 RepID=A0A4Y6I7Y5_9MOLU|nr:DUF31 family protein [Mycoplasma nasistruthionis]QDF65018.1 hypothetical protein FIV53_01745 [Mycoplasma nasistruthionis]
MKNNLRRIKSIMLLTPAMALPILAMTSCEFGVKKSDNQMSDSLIKAKAELKTEITKAELEKNASTALAENANYVSAQKRLEVIIAKAKSYDSKNTVSLNDITHVTNELKLILAQFKNQVEVIKKESKVPGVPKSPDWADGEIQVDDQPERPTPKPNPTPGEQDDQPAEPGNNDTAGDLQEPDPVPLPPFNPFDQNKQSLENYELAKNTSPEYINRYDSSKLTSDQIYEEIWKRTFMIMPGTDLNAGKENSTPSYLVDQGTGWVLDYSKTDDNHYKIFMATNMHVIAQYSNTLENKALSDKWNYTDPTGRKGAAFAFGKTATKPSFAPIPNNSSTRTPMSVYANNEVYKQYSQNPLNGNTTITTAFSTPKIVFAGVDFISDKAFNQFKPSLDEKWRDYKNYQNGEIERTARFSDEETLQEKRDFLSRTGKIPFYIDFGVFEFDVDLTKADDTFRTWILDAVSAVDAYVARMQNNNEKPNYTKTTNNNIMTLDYYSRGLGLDKSNPAYEFGLYNAQNIYIAGYPKPDTTTWKTNNPTERSQDIVEPKYNSRGTTIPNNKLFNYALNDVSGRLDSNNHWIYDKLYNRPYGDYYGFNYNVKFSSLYYGASGSVVYNEYGEIVGIYNGVQSNIDKDNLLGVGTFAPLLQKANLRAFDNKVIYGFNLIDGTGFAEQTRSYRQNLQEIYPNGFDGNGNKRTALFPEGY